jgi:hypothetical protein
MSGSGHRPLLVLAAGFVVLWMGWGKVFQLLPFGKACAVANPRGLHVDPLGRIAYANSHCPLQLYEHAWIVFVTASVVGVLLVRLGWTLRQRPTQPS